MLPFALPLAYLIGSVPFAVLVSRGMGLPDPRTFGSGNPGATNVMRTDHIMSSQHITINEKAFQALPADVQKIMIDAARESIAWGRREAEAETDQVVAKMTAEGAKVIKLNTAPFADKALSAVDGMEKDGAWTAGLYKRIRDIK